MMLGKTICLLDQEKLTKRNLITTPIRNRSTHTVIIRNKIRKENLFAPLSSSSSFPNPAKVTIPLFRDGEWSE